MGVVMTEIPLTEVPTKVLQRFSRDSELNAQFLHGRAAELIAAAEWFEGNSPDPAQAQHLHAIADSLNERAQEIEDSAEPLDAEIARRSGTA
jgi:hypothetical protein